MIINVMRYRKFNVTLSVIFSVLKDSLIKGTLKEMPLLPATSPTHCQVMPSQADAAPRLHNVTDAFKIFYIEAGRRSQNFHGVKSLPESVRPTILMTYIL